MSAEDWTCSKCGKKIPIEDVFVITHGGPKISLRPFCEPCVDEVLAKHQANFKEGESK